jgi:hypothetical protein
MLSERFDPAHEAARIPKDLTRMSSRLLASRHFKGVSVHQLKTRYEQVPVEIVRKIVEEQIQGASTSDQDQETRKSKLEEDLIGDQQEAVATSSAFLKGSPKQS